MATALQLPMTSSSFPPLFSSSSSHHRRHRSLQTLCCTNKSAQFPVNPNLKSNPSVNTKDSFLPKLASAPEASPGTDTQPFAEPLEPATGEVSYPTQVARPRRNSGGTRKRPPPDVASMFLDQRIVYICLPFVSEVTQLVIAELMFLESTDPDEPITIYIDSSGSRSEDGQTVARETEGFAIYDALMQLRCEIRTMAFGEAIGPACLLLAAGTKGKRSMLPLAIAGLIEPVVPSTGLMEANNVSVLAKEVITHRDMLAELMAKHTGQSVETIKNDMKKGLYFNGEEAIEYGIIDKILPRRQKKKRPIREGSGILPKSFGPMTMPGY